MIVIKKYVKLSFMNDQTMIAPDVEPSSFLGYIGIVEYIFVKFPLFLVLTWANVIGSYSVRQIA